MVLSQQEMHQVLMMVAAILISSDKAVQQYGLKPRAKVIGATVVGVEPHIMGFGPAPAIEKLLAQTGLSLDQIDVIELNCV